MVEMGHEDTMFQIGTLGPSHVTSTFISFYGQGLHGKNGHEDTGFPIETLGPSHDQQLN